MEKAKAKVREIRFYSKKNDSVMIVHTEEEKKYAGILESSDDIIKYETNVPLNQSEYSHVQRTGIRKAYFSSLWASSFILHYADGKFGVREIVVFTDLEKDSIREQLEFSRRYWFQQKAFDWKIVIMR